MLGKLFKLIFYLAFLTAFVWISGKLFFPDKINEVEMIVLDKIFPEEIVEKETIENLRIIFPERVYSLEPTLIDPAVRQRLVNIYEPLIKPDRDLSIVPALALSWGLIDEITWEFRLRPDVVFHDGSNFDAKDAQASIERAMLHKDSGLIELLSTISKVEVVDEMVLRIETYSPDPLLIQRLSTVLIFPSELKDESLDNPVGTASYHLSSWAKEGQMVLTRFSQYWGEESKFGSVAIFSVTNKFDRVNMIVSDEADFLAFVPYDSVQIIEEKKLTIEKIPSLEVQFLVFNIDSKFFRTKKARELVSLIVNQDDLVDAVGGFARPVSQFISNGVFGFNPDIAEHVFSREKAKSLAQEAGLQGETVQFHLPVGLDVLGEYMRNMFSEIGILAVVSYLDIEKLTESMERGDADLYFLAFKSDLGDSSSFLDTVVHSGRPFNIGKYSNQKVDDLIETSFVEFDVATRLDKLQEAMRIVVEEDFLGVPLFEYETLYAFNNLIEMQPRIDGLIYFDELIVD